MELSALAKSYRDFYAPGFAVKLGSTDLARDLRVAVSQVEVDLALGAASRFSGSCASDDSPSAWRSSDMIWASAGFRKEPRDRQSIRASVNQSGNGDDHSVRYFYRATRPAIGLVPPVRSGR